MLPIVLKNKTACINVMQLSVLYNCNTYYSNYIIPCILIYLNTVDHHWTKHTCRHNLRMSIFFINLETRMAENIHIFSQVVTHRQIST